MVEMVSLSFPSHVQCIVDGMWSLFQDNFLTDFDLIFSSSTDFNSDLQSQMGEGRHLRVHRLILAIFCPSLKHHLIGNSFTLNIDEMRKDDVDVIVEFIYRGKIEIEHNRLGSIKSVAETLGFTMLVDLIENVAEISGGRMLKRKGRPVKINVEKSVKNDDENMDYILSSPKMNEDEMESDSSDCVQRKRRKRKSTNNVKKSHKICPNDAFHPLRNQYVCQYCDKGFKSKGRFIIHIRCHENPDLLHKCSHCNYTTDGKHTLHVHLASKHHVDADGRQLERNIKCPTCDFTCFAKFQLSHHVFQRHSKPYSCDTCGYCCASRAILSSHQKAVHGNNERPFMCETCGYRAKTLLVFRRHLEVHTGKKVVCDICGLALTRYSFNDHMKLHSNSERPFLCHLCSFSARKRYKLKLHLRNVHKVDMESLDGNKTDSELHQTTGNAVPGENRIQEVPCLSHNDFSTFDSVHPML